MHIMFYDIVLGQLLLISSLSQVKNRIVVMSIHQPRYSIYKLFDTLTLLSVGNVVYHGNAHKALEYFDRIGEYPVCICTCM